MSPSINAVGFSNVGNKELWDKLVAEVFKDPSYTYMREHGEDKVIIEAYKRYAKQVYLLVSVVIATDFTGEPQVSVGDCEPYVESNNILKVRELEVEITNDEFVYYVVSEEMETGMELVFLLQNVVEYLDWIQYSELEYTGVKVVGIVSEGTIVLPIKKTEEDYEYEIRERKFLKYILEKAREGDKEAIKELKREEKQLETEFKFRVANEDILTIMDGYFLPIPYMEATYRVLGTIMQMEKRENNKTKEKMYWFKLDITGMELEVVVNTNILIGIPSVGMRFKGVCLVQGTIEFP